MNRALGRLPATPARPRLRLSDHLQESALPPTEADWTSQVQSWPLYSNDTVGDCTCVAAAHLIAAWTAYSDQEAAVLTVEQVIAAYSAVTGYDSVTHARDNGASMQAVLDFWRKTGVGGHKILAFAAVDLARPGEIEWAIATFGGAYVGVWLPTAASGQINQHQVWTPTEGAEGVPGSWGGHAIRIGAYDADGYTCSTWGQLQRMDRPWFTKYTDEAWVIITDDWLNASGQSPTGLDIGGLGSQFAALTGEQNPFPAEPFTPTDDADADAVLAEVSRRWMTHKQYAPQNVVLRAELTKWLVAKGL